MARKPIDPRDLQGSTVRSRELFVQFLVRPAV